MKKIDSSLVDFLTTVTTDFIGLIGKIEQMKDNMHQLKEESKISEAELKKAQIEANKQASGKFQPTIQEEQPDMIVEEKQHHWDSREKASKAEKRS